jgi:hypothetical protein
MAHEDLLSMIEHSEAMEQARKGEVTVKRSYLEKLKANQKTSKHSVNLVMGDPWDDGHGKSEVVMIETNLGVKEIQKAFKAGAKKIGIPLRRGEWDIADDYEENVLTREYYDKFVKHGFEFDVSEHDWLNEDELNIWTDVYVELYLFCVKKGNPDFEYEVIKSKNNIDIGGYGLFY